MSTPSIPEVLQAAGATVFERGWLSANNVLIQGHGPCALVDSGYCTHAAQTLALVQQSLGERPLDLLLNTHLHSDHCGGNAALQRDYPRLTTLIPPGQASAVNEWDTNALTYQATGQQCPRFTHQGLLEPGSTIRLGDHDWEIHGAKGHDPHSIVLFLPECRLLLSADALWQNGFGVVFPELEGISAFDEVEETLGLIESLNPQTVIPGHGSAFQDTAVALARSRSRLQQFQDAPDKHRRHALKVLIKFKLLEWQEIAYPTLLAWSRTTPYLAQFMPKDAQEADAWLRELLNELERSAALRQDGPRILNT
ncbi:MBL fold metallo-hydrolase [Hydrogenophaga sp.]|uniref:MBL fold metallo-hydrolase n=1 Tax=Hydrogenophaga sp. TaxID=1904254 RepID=UPI00286DD94E|nr:MBL fold metallo-hydrolase [Hydrogenophaga sp.]